MAAQPPEPIMINVHEAKSTLSKLLVRIEEGEEFVIARAGVPVARLVAVHEVELPRWEDGFGRLSHLAPLPDDFNDPDPEIERLFGIS